MSALKRPVSALIILGAALAAGLVVLAVLVPTSGADDRCYSLLAFRVSCEGEVALAAAGVAAVAVAALTGLGLWAWVRRRHTAA